MTPSQDHPSPEPGSTPKSVGALDLDELFWQKIRTLPEEVKARPEIHGMLLFKSKTQQLNRDIEDAIELRLAGWTASMPNGTLDVERVFAWQWRRPGPHGGRLFLSTQQAINALRNQRHDEALKALPPIEHFRGVLCAEPPSLVRKDVFGWFDDPAQTTPAHDPHPHGKCPVCGLPTGSHSEENNKLVTISLAVLDKRFRDKSYFFRCHKICWDTCPDQSAIESALIDLVHPKTQSAS